MLVELVGKVGLEAGEAARILAAGTYADEVRAAERRWQAAGISKACPSVVVEGRLSHPQPPEVFAALRQLAAG